MNPRNPNENLPAPPQWVGPPAVNAEQLLLFRQQQGSVNGLRDILTLFFKRKWCILTGSLVIGALCVAMVFIYTYFIYTPKFQARSLLLVKFGWENASPELSLDAKNARMMTQADIVNSEVRILQSRDLKERAVSALKPENIFPELVDNPVPGLSNTEAAIVKLEKSLGVSAGKTGNVIEVVLESKDPARAANFVNQLVRTHIDRRTEFYKDPKSVLFLEKKAEEFRQKLADAESRLQAFRGENKIIAFDEQRSILLKQRSDLVAALSGTQNQIREIQDKIGEMDKQLKSIPKTSQNNETSIAQRIRETENKLLNLQLQEKELLSKYKEDNRLVVTLREQIRMTQEYLANQPKMKNAETVDPLWQAIYKDILQNSAELTSLKTRYAGLEEQTKALDEKIKAFEDSDYRHRELVREVADNEEKYRTYRQRLEESRIHDELERQKMTSLSVIEVAMPPIVPVNPPKPLILLLAGALLAGIAGGFGIAFGLEKISSVISTPAEAEKRLDLPVLVVIPTH